MDVIKSEKTPPSPSETRPSAIASPFLNLREDVDRLFDSFFLTPLSRRLLDMDPFHRRGMLTGEVTPRMDVVETEATIEVTAELPGIAEKDIDISVGEGVVTIRGEKKMERDEKKGDYHLSERSFGSFARSFRLPENVDEDAIEASFDKGILTMTLPKKEKSLPERKKIEVKAKH